MFMKKVRIAILSIAAIALLVTFQNCGGSDEPDDPATVTKNILMSKTWTVTNVSVPANTATLGSDWADFTVRFNANDMVTSGHPTGASAVWPSTTYTVSADGKSVSRGDGVTMLLNPVVENNFTAIFAVPQGTEIGGRIEALGGDYTFNMK
jgi:hypothetical protein